MPVMDRPETAAAPVTAGQTAKKQKIRGRLPSKRSINLATVGVKKTNWPLTILAMVLIVAGALAFGKFLVYDRLETVTAAQHRTAEVQRQIDEGYAKIESYGELNDIYAHYTYSGFTEEERARVKRADAMDLLDRVVFPRTDVQAWSLSGNVLTLSIEGSTLQEINETVQALLADELVTFCSVRTAATATESGVIQNESETGTVTANIAIDLQATEAEK